MSNGPVQTVLERLEGVRRRGDGRWQARCPAHADHAPSLSVTTGGDGRALVHCHAGCTPESVCAAMSLPTTALFSNPPTAAGPRKRRRIVKTYHYTDENGEVLFEVGRYEPKEFTQYRPHPDGGRVWGLSAGWYRRGRQDWHRVESGKPPPPGASWLPECRRVLYRLPDLLRADPAEWVFVVEGEKDADRLADLGFVATTNPQGAGSWDDSYSDVLRGRRVVVIPDNDPAGLAHAQQVAASLAGRAAEVWIVQLPGLTDKGEDVSDWLDQGASASALAALVAAVRGVPAPDLADPVVVASTVPPRPTPTCAFTQDAEDVQENQDTKRSYVRGDEVRIVYDREMAAGAQTSLRLADYIEVARRVQSELRAAPSKTRCRSSPEFEALRIVKAHPTVAGLPARAAIAAVEDAFLTLCLPAGADPWQSVFGIGREDARTLFFCKWDETLCPAGAKLLDPVLQEARARPLRFQSDYNSDTYHLFLTAVYMMQKKKRGGLVMICGRAFADRLSVSATTVYSYIEQATKDGHLSRVTPHVYQPGGGGKCAEYRFQGEPLPEAGKGGT